MFRVVIPARYASVRFPGKPLADINGRPLLAWVHAQALRSRALEVIVATDDARIEEVARAIGAVVVMTRASHASGTDRIAEVAAARSWRDDEIVVNLQGDEPLMPPALMDEVATALANHAAAAIATAAAPIGGVEEFLDPNVVKVVIDRAGRALYFSRAPIPWHRDGGRDLASQREFAGALRHIGLYAYRVGALRRLAGLPPGMLEQVEKLEQLRALENGLEIHVVETRQAPAADVNTPADLARVAQALRR
ncbi:MAG: 3-deoxy-manno-octulosonate cytidylyltransferase [Steroidobacteraceae bacterium]